jgi:hypothetical protein
MSTKHLVAGLIRTKTLTGLFFVGAITFAAITLMLFLTACGSGTDTTVPTAAPASPSLSDQVDQAVANDGTSLELGSDALHTAYPDAYALVADDCQTMANQAIGGQGAEQWLELHLASSYSVPGEGAALKVGVPLVCSTFDFVLGAVN